MLQLEVGRNNLVTMLVYASVLLFPMTIVLMKDVGPLIFGLLALMSLVVFIRFGPKSNYSRDEKRYFYSCLFVSLSVVFVSWMGGFDVAAWNSAGSFISFLFVIPLYFLFKNYLRKTSIVWLGLIVSVIACGLMSIYEINFGSLYGEAHGRVRAAVHPIHFADVVLSMTVMLLAGMTTIKKWNSKIILLAIVILLLGITAVVLSKSRGAWITLPVLLIILLWQFKSKMSAKFFIIGGTVLPVLAIVVYLIPATGVQQRINQTIYNVQQYGEGTHKSTSIGQRFEMWQASIEMFMQEPMYGVGWGNYQREVKILADKKIVHESIVKYQHPHSQYLSALANGGILMLIALLTFFIVQLRLFYRFFYYDDAKLRSYALAGVVLVVGYMGYALSASVFERSIPATFFAFYLALFFALATRTKQEKGIEGIKRTKKLSVTIIGFNEVDRIEACFSSVAGWADEIIYFDNGSTDGTIEIAKKYTDNIFITDWPGFSKQKQRALDKAQYEWVLSIDADESLTEELKVEIDRTISADTKYNIFRIPMADIVYGKRMDFGRNNRAHRKLFLREGAYFSDAAVHEKVMMPVEKIGFLKERLLHDSILNLKHYVAKSNDYAWLWGEERFEKGEKRTWLSPIIHGLWKFIANYFMRLGMLDGFRGFIMAVHIAMYTFNKHSVIWTLNQKRKFDSKNN